MRKTDEQLAEILKKGLEAAEKTGNFVVEQAPDLIQQLIVWKTCEYILLILISDEINFPSFVFMFASSTKFFISLAASALLFARFLTS